MVKEKERFYLKPIVDKISPKQKKSKGIMGSNINNGFLRVTKTTKEGEFVSTEDIVFEVESSKEQNIDSLTKVILTIHKKGKEENYGVAIEEINLTHKKIIAHSKK